MATRRAFLSQAGAASAAAVTFRDHALDVVQAAGSAAGNAGAVDMATNEDYWKRRAATSERERFMAEVYKSDPRTQAASAMLSQPVR